MWTDVFKLFAVIMIILVAFFTFALLVSYTLIHFSMWLGVVWLVLFVFGMSVWTVYMQRN